MIIFGFPNGKMASESSRHQNSHPDRPVSSKVMRTDRFISLMGILWCFSIISLPGGKLSAQSNQQPHFRNYTTDDGLPSPEVHDIIQDQKGFIWIATDNGVSRFDGYNFRRFGAKEGLKNNVVFFLDEDPQGRIWMQTMAGNMYFYEGDSIYPYLYNEVFSHFSSFTPNGFILSEAGPSYFSLNAIGIIKIDPDGRYEVINRKNSSPFILVEHIDSSKTLFGQVTQPELKKFGVPIFGSPTSKQVGVFADTLVREYVVTLPGKNFNFSIRGFSDNTHQIFDFRKELNLFYRHRLQTRFPIPARATEIEKIDSTFWLGLGNKEGVWAFPSFSAMNRQEYKSYLSGNSITAICQDRLGGYWFGSLENGIFYAPNLSMEVIDRQDLFINNQVLAIEPWRDGQLLLGTNSGTLYSLDTANLNRIERVYSVSGSIFDLNYSPSEGSIWIAGRPLVILRSGKESYLEYAPEFNRTSSVAAKKILQSRNGQYAYGISVMGLEVIDQERRQVVFTTFGTPYQQRFLDAFEDKDQHLWIGSVGGLLRFEECRFVPLPMDHSVFHRRIEAIGQLADSTLVLGTKGNGLALWRDSTVVVIDEHDGLTSNMVENIAINHQQIWVGTLNGLNLLTRAPDQNQWRVRRYTMAHGLPSNEINDLCIMGDWIYVATARGLVKLPLSIQQEADLPEPAIEKILVNGYPTDPDRLLHLSYDQSNIQIHFVCLNFKFRENIPYRYRLTSDAQWSYTQDRSVNYAALSPGDYLFEVQAQNEDGVWSQSLNIPFYISQPFWQRWWFVLLSGLFLLGLVYYWYRIRLERLEKEAAVEREINELQRSALQAQMNPHFIFNCLNAIQSFIASGKKGDAMEYLSRFAHLVRTTLNASTQATISLQEEIQVLENYLELEKLRFDQRFAYQIEVDPQLDTFDTHLPPLLVQPFVENAILHAFNFDDKTKVGQLHLAYRPAGEYLQVIIRDNGIGITRSKRRQSQGEPLRTSLGMSITQKRLSLHSQEAGSGQFRVRELKAPNGEVGGTEIRVCLKI